MARHHALLSYADSIQLGKGVPLDEPTEYAKEQHAYLTMQITPAMSTLHLLESPNASPAEVMSMYHQLKSDLADPVQQMLALESRSRFMRPTQVA